MESRIIICQVGKHKKYGNLTEKAVPGSEAIPTIRSAEGAILTEVHEHLGVALLYIEVADVGAHGLQLANFFARAPYFHEALRCLRKR